MSSGGKVFSLWLHGQTEAVIKPALTAMLAKVADIMVDAVQDAFKPIPPYRPIGGGNAEFPVWMGHMRDSTGVGIYNEGVLIAYRPNPMSQWHTEAATEANTQKYGSTKSIIGEQYLQQALNDGLTKYHSGIWIVLFSAVPYAAKINAMGSSWGRGQGYFDKFAEAILYQVEDGLKDLNLKNALPVGFKV
jgi:hypothetical protein